MRDTQLSRSKNRRRSPFASRHATVFTLRQSRHSPERLGASRRLLTTPSTPCRSAASGSSWPSSKSSTRCRHDTLARESNRFSRRRRSTNGEIEGIDGELELPKVHPSKQTVEVCDAVLTW